MHLVYYALGVCIVNGWLLYRRLPSKWYRRCIVNQMVAVQKTLPPKWYMHLVYYALGVCIVNRWLLYRRHCHQNGTCIQYTIHLAYTLLMHLQYALLMDVAVQKTLPPKWYIHLVYYALGVCIVNGWLLYRRHCHQNGTCIQYTMHLEYALLMDGCCIEDTASRMVHAFSILCTWSMHCLQMVAVQKTALSKWYMYLVYYRTWSMHC